ncbi:hypothetical protein GRB29_05145 [Streptococcus pneumoniae]|nr:hypothetical protein [Streptococcus pneumoniae]
MPYRYYFLLIGGLIVVPFLTGHFVWQTIPYIALIGASSNLLYLLRLKKNLSFHQPLWKERQVGTGISFNPESNWGYYLLFIIYMITIVVAFGIYLILIFPGLEDFFHRLTGWY